MNKFFVIWLIFIPILFLENLFGQTVPYRIRMPDSTYTAQLRGKTGTRTAGLTITGAWETNFKAHEFIVTVDGRYDLYFDPAGGSNYTKDTQWSGSYGKFVQTGYFEDAVDTDYDNKVDQIDDNAVTTSTILDSNVTLAKLSTAALNYIGAGGTVTNNPDDVSIENTTPTQLGVKRTWFDSKVDSAQDGALGSDRDSVNILTINRKVRGIVSYGADGTNANDTTAFNSLIAAASSGDVLYFPAGDYDFTNMDSVLVNIDSLTFLGAGSGLTTFNGQKSDSANWLYINASNIRFEGISFNNFWVPITVEETADNSAQYFEVINCDFDSVLVGVDLTENYEAHNLKFDNINITNSEEGIDLGDGIIRHSTFSNIYGKKIYDENYGATLLTVNDGSRVDTLTWNNFDNISCDSIYSDQDSVETHLTLSYGSHNTYSNIRMNYIHNGGDGTDAEGIYIEGNYNTIENVTAKDAGTHQGAISIKLGVHNTINNFEIDNGPGFLLGIYSVGGSRITNGTIRCDGTGIFFGSTNDTASSLITNVGIHSTSTTSTDRLIDVSGGSNKSVKIINCTFECGSNFAGLFMDVGAIDNLEYSHNEHKIAHKMDQVCRIRARDNIVVDHNVFRIQSLLGSNVARGLMFDATKIDSTVISLDHNLFIGTSNSAFVRGISLQDSIQYFLSNHNIFNEYVTSAYDFENTKNCDSIAYIKIDDDLSQAGTYLNNIAKVSWGSGSPYDSVALSDLKNAGAANGDIMTWTGSAWDNDNTIDATTLSIGSGDTFIKFEVNTTIDSLDIITATDTLRVPFREIDK